LYGASKGIYLEPLEDGLGFFDQISSILLQNKEKISDFYSLVNHQAKFYPKIESFFGKLILPLNEYRTIDI
jgi:hypothetical protein